MPFSGQKIHFLGIIGFLTHWTARDSKVVLELFVWGLIYYLSMKKKIGGLWRKKCQTNFPILTPTFLATSILVIEQVLYRIYFSLQ